MRHSISAIIFAGGKSSRMGQDKSLLPFGEHKSLAAYQYAKLNRLFENVYISAKDDKFDLTNTVIQDIFQESSPLVGLISIFETLKVDEVFILSVDAPFVDKEIIEKLLEANDPLYDIVVAQSPHGVQPLCGIYKRSILPFAYTQLKKENHRLNDLLKLARTRVVPFEEEHPFANLNHPEEYQEALMRFESSEA